ncbi:unnamed protein product [Trichobilharzia regenti]|nr:unnamed protein product [Trichobilharzia regenti]
MTIVDDIQFKKVMSYIEKGKLEGARLITGGNRIGQKGYFIQPTVFADVKDEMCIAKDEIFGPVQCILKFDTLEEVIERANATHYGLGGGVVTRDMDKAMRVAEGLEAGSVAVIGREARDRTVDHMRRGWRAFYSRANEAQD